MIVNDIKKIAGDYNLSELSLEFDRKAITKKIISELIPYKQLRQKWLVFGIDIAHCENITEELKKQGVKAACVHSKKSSQLNKTIDDFKNNKFQALVSVAMLTTGFNVPDVDLIILLRPTASATLHVQIIGRGLRTAPGKKDCLVLDFAGNTMRNGSIDNPVLHISGKGDGEPVLKECGKCFEIVHAAVKKCPKCNYEFKFKHHLKTTPDVVDLIEETWQEIKEVSYQYYKAKSGVPTLLVKYFTGINFYKEYICLEHVGYARYKAENWWKQRCKIAQIPNTVKQALDVAESLAKPKQVLVKDDKFKTITGYKF